MRDDPWKLVLAPPNGLRSTTTVDPSGESGNGFELEECVISFRDKDGNRVRFTADMMTLERVVLHEYNPKFDEGRMEKRRTRTGEIILTFGRWEYV